MNVTEIVSALEALAPPESPEEYPSFAARRDELVSAMHEAINRGEKLTEAHRAGLERAAAHAQTVIRVLEVRRDEVVTQRERTRLARRKVAEQRPTRRPGRIDVNA